MSDAAQAEGKRFYWIGVVLIVAGVLACLAPLITAFFIAMTIGVVFTAVGVLEIFAWFQLEDRKGQGAQMVQGVLFLLAGLIMLLYPGLNLKILSLVLTIYFGVAGVTRISAAMRIRPREGWGFVMLDGVLSLLLGAMLFAGWPLTGIWAIGVFTGIKLIFAGSAILMLGKEIEEVAA